MKNFLALLALALVAPSARAQNVDPYQAPVRFQKLLKTEKSDALIKDGFAIFSDPYPALKDLPLCLGIEVDDKGLTNVVNTAVSQWNELAQAKLKVDLLTSQCKKPEVLIVLDRLSGKRNDSLIKFGITLDLKTSPKKVVLIRQKEIDDFKDLLNTLTAGQLKQASIDARSAMEAKLAAYAQSKIEKILKNLLLHELGHVFGLAHNFNPSENSIMNYSDSVSFSDYDGEALAYRFGKLKSGNWKPELQPPAGVSTKIE